MYLQSYGAFAGNPKPKVEVAASGSYSARCVQPRPRPSRLAVAVRAIPNPAHLDVCASELLAVLEPVLERLEDVPEHRKGDGAERLSDLILEVIHALSVGVTHNGFGIYPILDVAPEAGIGKRNACHYAMWGAKETKTTHKKSQTVRSGDFAGQSTGP